MVTATAKKTKERKERTRRTRMLKMGRSRSALSAPSASGPLAPLPARCGMAPLGPGHRRLPDALEPEGVGRLRDDVAQLLRLEGLGDEVEGSLCDRLARDLDGRIP